METLRTNVIDYTSVFNAIISDPRYLANLDWGRPRPGHPEGTVRAHIAEIEGNLNLLRRRISEPDYWKLRVLIHTHDSFKAESRPGAPITAPNSHASLARAFLEGFCEDADLLAMVQFHDEPFALYRQFKHSGAYSRGRFEALLDAIHDWNLFLAFNLIDGSTAGKDRAPLQWLFCELEGRVQSRFTAADILLFDRPEL